MGKTSNKNCFLFTDGSSINYKCSNPFCENKMASYFDCDCLSLDAYLALIDVHDDLSELV
jgi:hypothetical protein